MKKWLPAFLVSAILFSLVAVPASLAYESGEPSDPIQNTPSPEW